MPCSSSNGSILVNGLSRINERIAKITQSLDIIPYILDRSGRRVQESGCNAALAHQEFPSPLKLIGNGLGAVQRDIAEILRQDHRAVLIPPEHPRQPSYRTTQLPGGSEEFCDDSIVNRGG